MGLGGIVGGLAGSVFGPVGSAIGYGLGSSLESNYYSNRAWNQQKDMTWEMWHANNDYNSPKSQMQRLEEAGLNPNLVYGNGGVTHQATMATTPKYQMPTGGDIQGLTMFQQLKNMEAQTELLKAQKRKVDVEANNTENPVTPYRNAIESVVGPERAGKAVAEFLTPSVMNQESNAEKVLESSLLFNDTSFHRDVKAMRSPADFKKLEKKYNLTGKDYRAIAEYKGWLKRK